jgi:hypothetical protein
MFADLNKKFYKQNELRGLIPQANYTDWATAACRRSILYLLNYVRFPNIASSCKIAVLSESKNGIIIILTLIARVCISRVTARLLFES